MHRGGARQRLVLRENRTSASEWPYHRPVKVSVRNFSTRAISTLCWRTGTPEACFQLSGEFMLKMIFSQLGRRFVIDAATLASSPELAHYAIVFDVFQRFQRARYARPTACGHLTPYLVILFRCYSNLNYARCRLVEKSAGLFCARRLHLGDRNRAVFDQVVTPPPKVAAGAATSCFWVRKNGRPRLHREPELCRPCAPERERDCHQRHLGHRAHAAARTPHDHGRGTVRNRRGRDAQPGPRTWRAKA